MRSSLKSKTQPVINTQGAVVLGAFIHALSWLKTIRQIHHWGVAHESRYVCICNVHSVITAQQNQPFMDIINRADMATPDGMPITWMLRFMGFRQQQRINGPDLMWRYCAYAAKKRTAIFLYGNTPATLSLLHAKLRVAFPKLRIAGSISPPFRPLTLAEDEEIVNLINASGAHVVFVSLGCPKQELWMAAQRGKVSAVMIGVGAAFDYHAGTLQRAPSWMQKYGLEWCYRLCAEPGRLWKRYFFTNSLFMLLATWQMIRFIWRAGFTTKKVNNRG